MHTCVTTHAYILLYIIVYVSDIVFGHIDMLHMCVCEFSNQMQLDMFTVFTMFGNVCKPYHKWICRCWNWIKKRIQNDQIVILIVLLWSIPYFALSKDNNLFLQFACISKLVESSYKLNQLPLVTGTRARHIWIISHSAADTRSLRILN